MSTRHLGLVLISLVSFTGCYTMLRHIAVERESYLSSEITHRDACVDCHSGYSAFSIGNPNAAQLPFTSPRLRKYNYYYHYPWWLEDYYYSASSDSESPNSLPIDPRQFGNRRGIDTYSPTTSPAPAGAGIQFMKKSTEADSTKKAQAQEPKKPETDRSKINTNRSERTKKERK